MSLPTGRSDRRITKEVAVELARPDASQLSEMASHCPKREHSRDAGSDGTRLAPWGPRVAKLSGVWRPYTGTRRLLSAHGKQEVCYRSGTLGLAGRMNQAAL